MKRLGITQRVEVVEDYLERRDCLDQRWAELALSLNYIAVPLPNMRPELTRALVDSLQLDAVLLSGGNTIAELDNSAADAAPERDRFEYALIDAAIEFELPIVGVCRGMQVINMHLGGSLSKLHGHVACRHPLQVESGYEGMIATDVNSFHHWGIAPGQLASTLRSVATDSDNNIEAFIHRKSSISGIMWHPERETDIRSSDLTLLKHLLK